MRVVVNRGLCTGQAMCESIAPDIFEINDDDELEVKSAQVPDSRLGDVQRAVKCCPNAALSLVP